MRNYTLKITVLLVAIIVNFSCSEDSNSLSNDNLITIFKFNNIEAVIDQTEISVTMPSGTDITALSATVSLSGTATISPDPAEARDYTNPVTFTVTAQDGSTTSYTVTVDIEKPCLISEIKYAANGTKTTYFYDDANRVIKLENYNGEGNKTSVTEILHEGDVITNSYFDGEGNSTKPDLEGTFYNNSLTYKETSYYNTVRSIKTWIFDFDDNNYLRKYIQKHDTEDRSGGNYYLIEIKTVTDLFYEDGNCISQTDIHTFKETFKPLGGITEVEEETTISYTEFTYYIDKLNKLNKLDARSGTPNKNLLKTIVIKDEVGTVTGTTNFTYELDDDGYVSKSYTDNELRFEYSYLCE